ncbi:hypothetical protein LX32DRAFT_130603 [Colletotrichum zoysiae]|uniref:Uncharacterized protein n=1 Tax=Colletotrichum zoysiae TaxID=1216348 RepID=A0AAD9H8H8_9PEZI|nr:hypothetical protein LX32DRAFT_130603 [Colletotrichum zoysiae]
MSHDHNQSRRKSGEEAERVHEDSDFVNDILPASGGYGMPLDVSYMGQQHTYDFSEADSGLGPSLPANLNLMFQPPPLQASDAQQPDPRQVLADVYAMLHTIHTPLAPLGECAVPLAPQPVYVTPSSTATYSWYSSTQSLFDPSTLNPHWAGDNISNHSGHTSNYSSRSELCSLCGARVNSRQMQRHQQDRHPQDGDPQYVCKCGHTDPAMRKWNYTRHLDKFCKLKYDSRLVFTCRCGKKHNDLMAHQDHIKDCGNQKAGRRPNNARNANN